METLNNFENKTKCEILIDELLNQIDGIQYGEVTLSLKIHNREIMSVDTSRKLNFRTLCKGGANENSNRK